MSPAQHGSGGKPPDTRPGREPEGASFAAAVAGRRGRPPIFLLAFLVGIAGLVVAGIGGRVASAPAPTAAAGAASPSAPVLASPMEREIEPAPTPQATRAMAPIVVSEPGSPIELTIRRHPASMFIHGDVYVAAVSWVFVNIADGDGRIAGWTQVSVPGGAVAPRGTRPALRFDVELALPDWATGPLSVRATAYASDGNRIASEELGVDADGSALAGGRGRLGIGG